MLNKSKANDHDYLKDRSQTAVITGALAKGRFHMNPDCR